MTISRRKFFGLLGIAGATPIALRGEASAFDDSEYGDWEDESYEYADELPWQPAPATGVHTVQIYHSAKIAALDGGVEWFAGPALIYPVGRGYQLDMAHASIREVGDRLTPPLDAHFSTQKLAVRMDADVILTVEHGMDVLGLVVAKPDGTLMFWVPVGIFVLQASRLTLSSGNDFLTLSFA